MNYLDTTQESLHEAKKKILSSFMKLRAGDAMQVLVKSHPEDIIESLQDFEGEIANVSSVTPTNKGFEIKLNKQKTMEPTIAEIVRNDFRTAEIFKRNGIDFCCGGKRTIDSACQPKGLDPAKIKLEIEALSLSKPDIETDFDKMSLTDLSNYITEKHHKYVTRAIPVITEFITKVARVHGHVHPENIEIASCFEALAEELSMHMHKEEMILFPFIKQLEEVASRGGKLIEPHFGTVKNPIRMMEHEHDSAGDLIKKIEELSNHFTPPQDACNTYRVVYSQLKEFRDDLFTHIHLENNILFPKAIALE